MRRPHCPSRASDERSVALLIDRDDAVFGSDDSTVGTLRHRPCDAGLEARLASACSALQMHGLGTSRHRLADRPRSGGSGRVPAVLTPARRLDATGRAVTRPRLLFPGDAATDAAAARARDIGFVFVARSSKIGESTTRRRAASEWFFQVGTPAHPLVASETPAP